MSPYCFYCFLVAPFYVRKRRRGEGFPNAQLVAKDFRSNKSAWSSSINNEGQTKVSVSVSVSVSAKKRVSVSVSVSVSAKNRVSVSVSAKILVSVHLYYIDYSIVYVTGFLHIQDPINPRDLSRI